MSARPILETLHHINNGTFLAEAAEKLADLVKAVDATGKAGSLTLKIAVRKASSMAMAVRGDITAKLPPESPIEALLFPTPDGNLLTDDPRQSKLPLAPVGAAPLPIAAVNQ
jgi:hypothetical protein